MIMSVYRQGQPIAEIDHLACIALATEVTDLDLINWAVTSRKPVLTALSGEAAVIKLQEPGDAGHSFEALYHDAINLRDITRMKAHGVNTPEAIGDGLYEVYIVVHIPIDPRVRIQLRARDDKDAKERMREYLEGNDFGEEICRAAVEEIFSSDLTRLVTAGVHKIQEPAPADAPVWEIMPRSKVGKSD